MKRTGLDRRRRAERFLGTDVDAAAWARALGHPARVAIVRFLARQAGCYCGQIVEELPLAQSTVSQHLRELQEAGLIQGTVSGVKVCYCLDAEGIGRAAAALGGLFAELAAAVVIDGPCGPAAAERVSGNDASEENADVSEPRVGGGRGRRGGRHDER